MVIGMSLGYNPSAWDFVGSVPAIGLPQFHVANLLKHNGINSLIEGSIVYGIQVQNKDRARTIAILQRDAKERPYMYWRVEGLKTLPRVRIFSSWAYLNCDLRRATTVRDVARDPLLHGLVDGIVEWTSDTMLLNREASTVSYRKISYMNTSGIWDVAYFGKITLAPKFQMRQQNRYGWSWDGGKFSSLSNGDPFRVPPKGKI